MGQDSHVLNTDLLLLIIPFSDLNEEEEQNYEVRSLSKYIM